MPNQACETPLLADNSITIDSNNNSEDVGVESNSASDAGRRCIYKDEVSESFSRIWVHSVSEDLVHDLIEPRKDQCPGVNVAETTTTTSSCCISLEEEEEEREVPGEVNEEEEGSLQRESSPTKEDKKSSCVIRGFHTPVASQVEQWIKAIDKHGFEGELLQRFLGEVNEEDDDTWFEEGVVRVFDPYYDLEPDEIHEVVEGRLNPKTGLPCGQCVVQLKNGDELLGHFRYGVRNGKGSIEGENLLKHGIINIRGTYRKGLLCGEGRAIIAEGAMWSGVKRRLTLEGVFNEGYLEGPVKGIDDRGNLVFMGEYVRGLPSGPCWLAKEGQGWLYGEVDNRGRFTGDHIAYIYPDLQTCMVGKFVHETMATTVAGEIVHANLNDAHIMVLSIEVFPEQNDAKTYSYSPSTATKIACDWLLPDFYESITVECKPSRIEGAGDGLFAKRDLPEDTIVSYYNGLRVLKGDQYESSNSNYQIYVDWANTEHSPFIDVPFQCVNPNVYLATLGHKANHSFTPNCMFVTMEHPRFGRIPALKTISLVKAGEELFSHYKYDMALAPSWYLEAWEGLLTDDKDNPK